MPKIDRPLPGRTEENARFWDSCGEHAMELQRCGSCRRFRYHPGPTCPYCFSPEFSWTPVSGRGRVYSFTWVHRAAPGFEELAPYAYALVELEEGPLLATDVVGVEEGELRIGLPVGVTYLDLTDEITLPLFGPDRV